MTVIPTASIHRNIRSKDCRLPQIRPSLLDLRSHC